MGALAWLRRLLRRAPAAGEQLEPGSLRDSLAALLGHLRRRRIDCALVGGVALAARGVVRGTRDLDFLIPEEKEQDVYELMTQLGFETLDRGQSVSSYLLERLRVDFLIARREYGRRMIERAEPVALSPGVSVRVALAEDLIAMKLQAMVGNPSRGKDRADIEGLLRAHADSIKMDGLREYARAIGAESELEAILADIAGRRG